ncbi:hydroxymethylbilane synthase [Streptomyces iconiensis]|uniref:Hydroxymethylbilane synthase n=1 Tax=Streptomyces iconiensis TaxID=1384038 RepID=A0ABT7AAW2_9ACTN|nr:hydroxymethylbilane synthase [Streptomyces iconiensis]MDJ1138485.1 hydroxymethylbilane synthase [Streptomyces iconiensis]
MTGTAGPLRIGTRSSPMALAQTAHVCELLRRQEPGLALETVPVTTEADRWHGDLSELGGKGGFVKEIDVQLQRGEIDMAIHCLKDIPGDVPLPEGLLFAAVLPRADVRDVLVVPEGSPVTAPSQLPPGATVASSSVRRRAQLLALRPDLHVARIRGAIGTRLDRLDGKPDAKRKGKGSAGVADALIVARAGLERLERTDRIRYEFPVTEMVPPVGAGVLALECRQDDTRVTRVLERLNDAKTQREATAERAMLRALRGHCNSPIAGHCGTGPDGQLTLRGMVFTHDGSHFAEAHHEAAHGEDPATLGSRVATALLHRGARALIDAIPH